MPGSVRLCATGVVLRMRAGTSNRPQPSQEPVKLTAQPVIVLQPDSSIAYTFRDLVDATKKMEPETPKGAAAAADTAVEMVPRQGSQFAPVTAADAQPSASEAAAASTAAGGTLGVAAEAGTVEGRGAAGAVDQAAGVTPLEGTGDGAAGQGEAAADRVPGRRFRRGVSLRPQAPLFSMGADAERATPFLCSLPLPLHVCQSSCSWRP